MSEEAVPLSADHESPKGVLPGLRDVPVAVWALTGLQLLLLVFYALLAPVYRAPDEPDHLDMIFAVADGEPWPGPADERRMTAQVVRSYDHVRFDLPGRRDEPALRRADAPPRPERPTFDEVAPDEPTGPRNIMFQHPPGYYRAAAAWLAVLNTVIPGSEGWSFDVVVVVVRLFSVLCVAPLPLLAYLAARRIGVESPAALAAAVLPLGIPTLTHIGSAVNNDNLLTLAAGVVTVALAGVIRGDVRVRTAAVVGVMSAVALLTKGFALVLPAVVLAAYARAASRVGIRQVLLPLGVTAALAMAGAWWWLRNLVIWGTVQPTGSPILDPPSGFEPDLLEWLGVAARWLPQRFWGSFGWYQAFLPWPAWRLASLVVVLGAVVGVTVARGRRDDGPTRWDLAVLLVPLFGILGIVLYGAYGFYAASGIRPALQGRYLYPALVGMSVVTAAGWQALVGRWRSFLPLSVLAGAGVMQVIGVLVLLDRFYGPPEAGLVDRVSAFSAWAAWPPAAVAAIALGVVVAAALAALTLMPGRARMWHRGPTSTNTTEAAP